MKKKTKKIIRRVFFAKDEIHANKKIDPKKLIFLRVNKIKSTDFLGKDYLKIKNKKINKSFKSLYRLKKNFNEKI